ncbi:hypothetical protein Tco_0741423 [Tanacetum coccineum]
MKISLTNMNANKLLMSVQFRYSESLTTHHELSSSKLVPKVVPPADKTATSRQELELLFHHHITMLSTMNENKGRMSTKVELTLKQSQQGVSDDVLALEGKTEVEYIMGQECTMLIADIEDDFMDPVMQLHTLPAIRFLQKKLVSFVHGSTVFYCKWSAGTRKDGVGDAYSRLESYSLPQDLTRSALCRASSFLCVAEPFDERPKYHMSSFEACCPQGLSTVVGIYCQLFSGSGKSWGMVHSGSGVAGLSLFSGIGLNPLSRSTIGNVSVICASNSQHQHLCVSDLPSVEVRGGCVMGSNAQTPLVLSVQNLNGELHQVLFLDYLSTAVGTGDLIEAKTSAKVWSSKRTHVNFPEYDQSGLAFMAQGAAVSVSLFVRSESDVDEDSWITFSDVSSSG